MVQVGSKYHKVLIDSNRLDPPKVDKNGNICCINKRILGSIPLPFYKGEMGVDEDRYEMLPLEELHSVYNQLDKLYLVDGHPKDYNIKTALGRNSICGNISNPKILGHWAYGDVNINTDKGIKAIQEEDKIFTSIAYNCYVVRLKEPYMWSDDLGYFGKPGSKIPIKAFHRNVKLLHLGMTPYPRASALTVLNSISKRTGSANRWQLKQPNLGVIQMEEQLTQMSSAMDGFVTHLNSLTEIINNNPLFQSDDKRNEYLTNLIRNAVTENTNTNNSENTNTNNSEDESNVSNEADVVNTALEKLGVNKNTDNLTQTLLEMLITNGLNGGSKSVPVQNDTIDSLHSKWKLNDINQ